MSLMRNSLVASGAIFACRLTGMAREIVYTSLFGATGALDAFYTRRGKAGRTCRRGRGGAEVR